MLAEQSNLKLKGVFEGNCNRTACQKPDAIWFNHGTHLYYCRLCALKINAVNRKESRELYGHDLCTAGEFKQDTHAPAGPLQGPVLRQNSAWPGNFAVGSRELETKTELDDEPYWLID